MHSASDLLRISTAHFATERLSKDILTSTRNKSRPRGENVLLRNGSSATNYLSLLFSMTGTPYTSDIMILIIDNMVLKDLILNLFTNLLALNISSTCS